MNIMVEIQREKVELALQVFNNLSFVKKAIPIRPNKKELFLIALEQSAKEVKAAMNGKKKLKTLEEAINEL